MATPADADIILKLYDLRREAVMRKARAFVALEFWPETKEEFSKVHHPGTEQNAYWRQVISYWEMASTLALHGAVDAALFADTQGEAFFVRAKFADMSQAVTGNTFMPQTLKLVESSESIKQMYADRAKNVEAARARMAATKA